jgi:cell division FtsZ-interacting protein ZapD
MILPPIQLEMHHTRNYRKATAETHLCTMVQLVQSMMIQVRLTANIADPRANLTKREHGTFSFLKQQDRVSFILDPK